MSTLVCQSENYRPAKWYRELPNEYHRCWYCGRSGYKAPVGWFGPWLIERAHIVSSPRVEDRRVIIMLCSLCHRTQHGEWIVLAPGEMVLPKLTLAQMLGLKALCDPEWYDREFIAAHHVGKLPRRVKPKCSIVSVVS